MKLPGIDYTSVLQVPNSKGGRLIREVAKIEPRLTKTTGYQVKLIEGSGRPLAKLLSPKVLNTKCHRADCLPCQNPDIKGSTMCSTKNVVYEGVCETCDQVFKADPVKPHTGRYVGQTYRTLYERADGHAKALRRMDISSFMFKH